MAKRALVSLAALLGLALSLGFASAGATQPSPRPRLLPRRRQPRLRPAEPGYAGMDTCVTCHEDTAKAFQHTPHAGNAQGCEGCHGPGQAHVDGGGDKTKIRVFKTLSPVDSSATCMECHNKGDQKHWMGSTHDSRNIACVACHDPHPKGEVVPKALLSKPQMVLCTGCHLQKKAQLLRPGHMPMREGKLQCTSCHNPHGTPNDKMLLQTSVNQNCYTCHAEKRGPFLWEHPPGPRELPELPRCPRHHQREDAEGEGASPLPAVPSDGEPPRPGLSRAVAGTPSTRAACTATPRSTGRSTRRATGSSGRGERP